MDFKEIYTDRFPKNIRIRQRGFDTSPSINKFIDALIKNREFDEAYFDTEYYINVKKNAILIGEK